MGSVPRESELSPGNQLDPPVPAVVGSLVDMTPSEVRTARLLQAAFGLVLGAVAFVLYLNGHMFWTVVFSLGATFFLALMFMPNSKVAICLYCGHRNIGSDMQDEKKELQCERCYEYLVVDRGTVRAMAADTVSEQPRFVTPVFQDAEWPVACAACGAVPTRFDELKSTSVNVVALAIGRVRTMSGMVRGVPYCDQHKECVTLSVTQDRKLELKWSSLRMMRRYLALNRSREAMRTRR